MLSWKLPLQLKWNRLSYVLISLLRSLQLQSLLTQVTRVNCLVQWELVRLKRLSIMPAVISLRVRSTCLRALSKMLVSLLLKFNYTPTLRSRSQSWLRLNNLIQQRVTQFKTALTLSRVSAVFVFLKYFSFRCFF